MEKKWWAVGTYDLRPFAVADGTVSQDDAVTASLLKGASLVSHVPETRQECRTHITAHSGTSLKKGYGFGTIR